MRRNLAAISIDVPWLLPTVYSVANVSDKQLGKFTWVKQRSRFWTRASAATARDLT